MKNKRIFFIILCVIILIAILIGFALFLLKDNHFSGKSQIKKLDVNIGDVVELKKQLDYSDLSSLEFYSSNDDVAYVDPGTGYLYAKSYGEVTITIVSKKTSQTIAKYTIMINGNIPTGTIEYEKNHYNCKVGETFDTMISVKGELASVKDFRSMNPRIAEVTFGTKDGLDTNCVDCRAVHVSCKKEGTVVLTATSSTGATTTAVVSVHTPGKGWVRFDEASYSCKTGQKIDVLIHTGSDGEGAIPMINEIKSNNPKVATIESGTTTGMVTNCVDCYAAHLVCKSEGTATVSATSSTGASASVSVHVEKDMGWIRYEQESYSCIEGKVINTLISTGAEGTSQIPYVKDFKSSNTAIATVENGYADGSVTDCIDCRAVHITCKKEGTVTLSAISSSGASTTSTVKVSAPDKGWIKFDQNNYSCKAGQSINVMITAGSNTPGVFPSIKSMSTSNPNIATIEDGYVDGTVTNCIDCRAAHIVCKKEGTVTLTAVSSTGVKTTSSKVTVEKEIGWIKYEQEQYTCSEGRVIDTMIRAGSNVASVIPSVAGFSSSNTNVASVENGTSDGMVTNCIDCRAVHIVCKKAGSVTLTATSSTGASTTSKLTVKEADKGTIYFDQPSYTCKVGKKVDVMIKTSVSDPTQPPASISSISSSNTAVATLENGTSSGLVTNCIDCRAAHITCKKVGTSTLKAISSTGAIGTATVTVSK